MAQEYQPMTKPPREAMRLWWSDLRQRPGRTTVRTVVIGLAYFLMFGSLILAAIAAILVAAGVI
jgi:hypothetical protein